MKKLLIVAIAMLSMLLLLGTANAAVVMEGPCGDNGDNIFGDAYNATYEMTTKGVMTIRGTGAMTNRGSLGHNPFIKEVIIEDGITSLGIMAFDGCYNLTRVTIPGSVTFIGHSCFEGCSALTTVNIPSGVTAIGENCFNGCDNLTIICNADSYAREYAEDAFTLNDVLYLPESTTEISAEAFRGVAADAIYLPDGCTFVGENAFADCPNLKLVVKPAGLTIS